MIGVVKLPGNMGVDEGDARRAVDNVGASATGGVALVERGLGIWLDEEEVDTGKSRQLEAMSEREASPEVVSEPVATATETGRAGAGAEAIETGEDAEEKVVWGEEIISPKDSRLWDPSSSTTEKKRRYFLLYHLS